MEGRGAETTSPGGSEGASRPPEEGHTLSAAERAAAFGRTEPTIPTRFIVIVVAVAVVLAVGGLVGEHVFSSVGLNPTAGSAGTGTGTGVGPGPAAPTVVDPPTASTPAAAVSSSLSAFMGLSSAAPRPAPGFSLVDQTGDPVTLAGERGRVVVLTFFDAPCQDICPVLSAELVQAAHQLGAAMGEVTFLTVDTDPLALSAGPAEAAAARTGLAGVPQWRFLTGSLTQLDPVWRAYGVSINVERSSGLVAHNDVMDFIDPGGDLRYRATPYADEDVGGAYSLPASTVTRWAGGIAATVRRILAPAP